jgi:drug/metabolite transporter (DMT)-like permease
MSSVEQRANNGTNSTEVTPVTAAVMGKTAHELQLFQEAIKAHLAQDIAQLQAEHLRLWQAVAELQTQQETLAVKQANLPLALPDTPLPAGADQPPFWRQLQTGLWLVLISTLALSCHNVVVRILGRPSSIFDWFELGGFIQLNLGNSLLILWIRMLIVAPVMAIIAPRLYPNVWKDLKQLLMNPDRRTLLNVISSGVFLFLSQILIYIAIGQIGPSAAVTILFMYPIFTLPLAWWLFGDRPTTLRIGVMGLILLGVLLTALPNLTQTSRNVTSGGVLIAAGAGLAFAFYLIFMQLGFRKLHPVPVSLVQFLTIFVFSSVSLTLPLQLGVELLPDNRFGFVMGGLVLGALTLVGYLSNNFGVRQMGAARASIVASSGPVITALLAFLIIGMPLQWVQVGGILLVTIGVTALSFERMLSAAAKQ